MLRQNNKLIKLLFQLIIQIQKQKEEETPLISNRKPKTTENDMNLSNINKFQKERSQRATSFTGQL